jgi:FkbH-like protein
MNQPDEVQQAVAAGDVPAALSALRRLWARQPGAATAAIVLSATAALGERLTLRPWRIALLRSYTVEPLVPLLRAQAALRGLDLQVSLGGFNTVVQDLIDPRGAANAAGLDAVFVLWQTRDLAPGIWEPATGAAASDPEQVLAELRPVLDQFRAGSTVPLGLATLEAPMWTRLGVVEAQSGGGQRDAVATLNQGLREYAARSPGVFLVDVAAAVARVGQARWFDPVRWASMRFPLTSVALSELARELERVLLPLAGVGSKVVVTDLDNTLWGGVIGEDGMEGIRVGPEHPGASFLAVQRALLDLTRRGILLAVCSKNNSEDAREVFEHHPQMLLRLDQFAAMRINWSDKASNLRAIAAELNVGIDALAFVDDNPAERDLVRRELPEVHVVELPDDPSAYADCLRSDPMFERLRLTAEDAQRVDMYRAERQRRELQEGSGSLETFYRSLDMQAEIEPLSAENVARLAQLTQKTNQFNLTTRRYGEAELLAVAGSRGNRVLGLRARDRFGDHGLVGVVITRADGDQWDIDSLLLSCRVIGRTIETALLAYIAEEAARAGALALSGWYLPTRKNGPAQATYPDHGFQEAEHRDGGGTRYVLALAGRELVCPPWIQLTTAEAVTR